MKNSATEEREQLALESIVARIRANLDERARLSQNIRELEERDRIDTQASQKKLTSIVAYVRLFDLRGIDE